MNATSLRFAAGEAPAGSLRVGAQGHRLGVLRMELLDEFGPQDAGGAHLADFHEEIHADAPEEAKAGRELIDVEAGGDAGAQILTETQYDTLGRVKGVISPGNATTKHTPSGHQLPVDPAGKKTLRTMDAFGRIESVTEDPGGQGLVTNYLYTVLDDLRGVCQGAAFEGALCGAGGLGRSFGYDSVRRLATAKNPETGTVEYRYDNNGNLKKRTDANGVSVEINYDALNRPKGRSYSDGTPTVSYQYDDVFKGRMHQISNSFSVTSYTAFDAMGRVLASRQTTGGTAYPMVYEYNLAGGLAQEVYPSGKVVSSCYDVAGRVSEVKRKENATAAETTVAKVTAYADHGEPLTATIGPVTESTGYNLELQMTSRIAVAAQGTWQMSLEYCPGAAFTCTTNNGNVLGQTAAGNARWDYEYDALNRLKRVQEKVNSANSWMQEYKYDQYGNRSMINKAGTLIPYELGTPRVGNETDASPYTKNQWNGAEYDPAGNQRTSWGNGTAVGAAKYFHDGENRVRRAEVQWPNQGQGVVEYGYDGEGRRVSKSVGGVVKTVMVYDAMGQLVAEYGEMGSPPCSPCYFTQDHLGSTRAVWGAGGTTVKLYDYAPFGEEVTGVFRGGDSRYPGTLYPRAGWQGVALEFTGKERDAETGLDYFGARYMSSAQGRFTSPDPLLSSAHIASPQSWNRYAYTLNNPLRFTDPFGLYICNGTNAECKDFESSLKQVERARNSYKKGSAEYNALNGSLQAYGKKGVDNGVTVQFGATRSGGAADANIGISIAAGTANKMVTADNPSGQDTVVTFDLSKHMSNGSVDIGSLAISAAHEGIHVGHGTALVGALPMDLTSSGAAGVLGGPLNLTKYATEFAAYSGSSYTAQGLGVGSLKIGGNFEIWNSGWKAVDVNTLRSNGINGVLSDPNGLYKVTPGAPGKKLIE